jgi:hypothetical protein
MAFFRDSQGDACDANDISKAITLATESVPNVFTCFNMSDLFGGNSSSGFQHATSTVYGSDGNIIEPNGVAWQLSNMDQYDGGANYSQTWYDQRNFTDAKEGEDAPWAFYVYAFPNCKQLGPTEAEPEESPWFETSCRTSKSGQCRNTQRPIRSFAINKAVNYNIGHGGCEAWAKLGDASVTVPGLGMVLPAVTGVLTVWFVTL